jgi:hypothetical protein
VLPAENIVVGEDVYTYGFYSSGADRSSALGGYFKGHIVGFRMWPPDKPYCQTATLSYPIIEGLSLQLVAEELNMPIVVSADRGVAPWLDR